MTMPTGSGTSGPTNNSGPEASNQLHRYDDLDTSPSAHHHTLGREDNQAASGQHKHDGKDSAGLPGYSRVDHEHVVDGSLLLPTGAITLWAGSSTAPPSGFMVCEGQAISRTNYSTLFGIIGTTYGAGDGSTTFNLPNLSGRFPYGATPSNLGVVSGRVSHSHGSVSHNHGDSGHNHNGDSHSHSDSGHSHAGDSHNHTVDNHSHGGGTGFQSANHVHLYTQGVNGAVNTNANSAGHTHALSSESPGTNFNSGTTGTGYASLFSNNGTTGVGYAQMDSRTVGQDSIQDHLPPYLAINFIIRTGTPA